MTKLFNKKDYPEKTIFQEIKGLIKGVEKEIDCVQVGITSFCSGRCEYCPRAIQENSWISTHMSPETYSSLWDMMQTSARIHLQGWGEPLLHPHFFEFVELARRADCRVSTTTCALYMNEEIATKIVKSGIDIIAFSLAGTDEVSNSSRHKVSFEKVIENIKILQKVRKELLGVHLEIHIAYLVLSSQIDAIASIPKLMQELDVHGIVISTLDCDANYSEYAKESFQPEEEEKILSLKNAILAIEDEIKDLGMKIHYQLPQKIASKSCREHAEKTCYVDAEGVLSPCIYLNLPIENNTLKTLKIGNIAEHSALKLWNTIEYQEFRAKFASDCPPEICLNCPKRFER